MTSQLWRSSTSRRWVPLLPTLFPAGMPIVATPQALTRLLIHENPIAPRATMYRDVVLVGARPFPEFSGLQSLEYLHHLGKQFWPHLWQARHRHLDTFVGRDAFIFGPCAGDDSLTLSYVMPVLTPKGGR